MSRPCSVCAHLHRAEIDRRLASPVVNLAALSRDYSVDRNALRRHREQHLPRLLIDLDAQASALDAATIHAQAQQLYLHALDALALAEAGQHSGTDERGREVRLVSVDNVVKALREARGALEMLTKLAMAPPVPGSGVERVGAVELDRAVEAALAAALSRQRALVAEEVIDAESVELSSTAAELVAAAGEAS